MRVSDRKGWLMLALSMTLAAPGLAADGPLGSVGEEAVLVEPAGESWGTTTDIVKVVGSGDLFAPNNTVPWATAVSGTTGLGVFQNGGAQIDWWYQFHLPSGAILQRIELEACDTSATVGIGFGIARGVVPAGAAANISAIGTTGVAPTPGCALFPLPPTAATTINNLTSDYWVFFAWQGGGAATVQVHSIRFVYRLQVSPGPGVATFPTDVPTSHPLFRFVEALAASGITGGCAPGAFCPDANITRGQMAVFLATALGLHFPN